MYTGDMKYTVADMVSVMRQMELDLDILRRQLDAIRATESAVVNRFQAMKLTVERISAGAQNLEDDLK